MQSNEAHGKAAGATVRPPLHPYVVLLVALLLPGVGQLLNNMPGRAAAMVFYTLVLGVVSYHLTSPGMSFVGRHAGGLFIYAIAVLDAYRWARYRWEVFHRAEPPLASTKRSPV